MNGYELTSNFYNYKFDSNGKVRHTHADLYFYIVDLWNRLGQKPEFGLPTTVAMESVGMGSYNTYKNTLNDLIAFGFIKLVKDSNNQHSSKIIALSKIDEPTDKPTAKPLDKATIKASDEPTDKPTDTIVEQEIINYKQEIIKLKKEKEIFQEKISTLTFEVEKLKSELSEKKGKSQKESSAKEKGISKIVHGEHENVYLSLQEAQKLFDKYGKEKFQKMVERLSVYKLNGKKYKSDYGAILNWVAKAIEDDEVKQSSVNGHNQPKKGKFETMFTNMRDVLSEMNSNEQHPIINQ